MNITSLQTFMAIVKTGSLVGASQVMNVTQSTVTARLQSLESELGQTLVIRQKNGAVLTSAGIRLRRYAEVMTQLWAQARQDAALPSGISAVCNIGCPVDLWVARGEILFDALRNDAASLALSVWHGSDAQIVEWLANGLVDVAFCYRAPPPQAGQKIYELPPDHLVLAATERAAPMRHNPSYVFVESGPDFERQHTEAYADADTAKLSFSSAEWALAHILKRGGSAYLPARMITGHMDDERLFAIVDAPVFTRPAYLVTGDANASYIPVIEATIEIWEDANARAAFALDNRA